MMYMLEVLVMDVNKMQPGEVCIYYVYYSRRISPFQILLQLFYVLETLMFMSVSKLFHKGPPPHSE